MATDDVKRKLTAIFSADVEGYSRLMGEDELATVETLTSHKETMGKLIRQYRGRVVDSTGDNLLAEFTSVVDAVQCAVEVQQVLSTKNEALPENRRMYFRIGINLGDVLEEGERIYGDGVNIAARVESLAEGGGISLSGTAYDQLGKKLPLGYEYLGEQSVKNIEKPVRVYRVLTEAEAAGKVIGEKRLKPTAWRWAVVAAVIVFLVAGVFAVWNFYFRPAFEPASVEKMAFPLPENPSIAVLPFDNLSGDEEQDYLVDGLTESIIGALSKIPEMFVIARNSTNTYKKKPVKVQQVAQDLGVRYVLEGTLQKSSDRLRVTAQLIDALKGYHVWSEKYDRQMKDLFAVQDDITLNIAVAMQVELTEGEQARVRHQTGNIQAWSLAVKAHGLFETYRREDNAKARELFNRAVEFDPNYAYAWTYLGWTHWIDAVFYSAYYNQKEAFERAAGIAQRALSIDDNLSDAHALLSAVNLSQRKFDEAVAAGQKSVALDPNSAENHAVVAITMQNVGEFETAITLLKQAMRLHPYYPRWYLGRLGMSYRMIGRYEESAAALEEYLERGKDKKHSRDYLYLATTYSMMGRDEEARSLVAKALELNPKMSVESWRKRFLYKDPVNTERCLDALRKAGLPETPPLPLPDKPSIAVLPFVNMSGDPEQEFFSDGITEEIITALSKTPKLFVIARNSTFTYKGKPVRVQQVGRELGVKYVLEGSVRKAEDMVRITAQLVDAQTGNHLWAERYDRNLKDIFALQDEITMKVVTALQVKLTEGEQARMWAKKAKNLDVYLKQMEALSLWGKGTQESLIRLGQVGQEIVKMAPESAIGYRVLAWYYWGLATYGGKSPRENIPKAFKWAQKAISLDESYAGSHALLGSVYFLMRQFEKAIAAGERSVELLPNGAMEHGLLGITLSYTGRLDEAITYLKRGIRLDPIPPYWYYSHLGRCYYMKGQYEEALAEVKKALQLAPDSLLPYVLITATYSSLSREEEARAAAKKVLEINPKSCIRRGPGRYKNPADNEIFNNALRKAGLPDCPPRISK
jgi:adenylate cyclase